MFRGNHCSINGLLVIGIMLINDILFRSTAMFYHEAASTAENVEEVKLTVEDDGGRTDATRS